MGMGAALNLVKHGHEVHGCELREPARAELQAAGGNAVARAADLPGGAGGADRVRGERGAGERGAVRGRWMRGRAAAGAVVLCCTTVAPEAARALSARLSDIGVVMLDTPVSGGMVAARGGSLTVMASGPEAGFEKAQPVLDAIAGKVWRLGDTAGSAAR